ncbi:MAG: type I phosphomannose isomerase catalytic subunit [Planctomycetota bacterium]
MPETTLLYPLLFEPIYKEKVWGGRAFERLGRTLPGDADTPIGESWELVDLASTSASGGGGNAEHSVIANGPLAGTSIDALIDEHQSRITGDIAGATAAFPLLIKYLDASENLSVQVHPSPEYAAVHPEAHLKSEAWYIVDAKPGAVIYKGLKPGVDADQFRAALAANHDDAVLPLLNTVPVAAGDCHYLPSGTCHALGAGVLVAEVQTPSDTTFRVYDWGRTHRELHVDQAIACIDFESAPSDGPSQWEVRVDRREPTARRERLVRCPFFQIERIDAKAGHTRTWWAHQPEVWMLLSGQIAVSPRDGEPVVIGRGQTALLAPGTGPLTASAEQDVSWLRVTVPNAG